jgi:hypothetical protein
MALITKDNIAFALAILTAIPIFKNGILSLAAWNRRWSIRLMEKEIVFTQRLRDDSRAYYTFIAKYVFTVLAAFATNMMFSTLGTTDLGQKLYVLERFMSGAVAYLAAVFALGTLVRIEKADETIARLEKKLGKLSGNAPQLHNE